MHATKEQSRKEFLDAFRKNIAEAEAIPSHKAVDRYVLVNQDCSMAICKATDGSVYRFGGMTSGSVETFFEADAAIATANGWNSRLNNEQRDAGCIVKVMEYSKALREFIQLQQHLITVLEAVR